MPTYNIGGKRVTTTRELSDSEIDEIAQQEGGATSLSSPSATAGPFKFTRGPDSDYEQKTPDGPPEAPWYSLRDTNLEKVGSEPGIGASNVSESPRWLGATIGSMLGGGPVGATVGAALGGAGGKSLEQIIDYATGNDKKVPVTTSEALKQQGLAGLETGAAEALGQGLGVLGGKLIPKGPELDAGFPGRRSSELAPAPAMNPAANTARAWLKREGQQEAANARLILDEQSQRHPLGNLTTEERGLHGAEAVEQAGIARRRQENALYRPLDKIPTDISDLVGDDAKALSDAGVKIPKEIQTRLDAVRKAQAALPAVAEDEMATSPELDMAKSRLADVPFSALKEMRSEIGQKLSALQAANHPSAHLAGEWYDKLSGAMKAGAEEAGMAEEWTAANNFHIYEVMHNHGMIRHPGASPEKAVGKEIAGMTPAKNAAGDRAAGGAPELIHTLIRDDAPLSVEALHRTMVPKGEWAADALTKSGQKAFDQVVEQKLMKTLTPNSAETIDLPMAMSRINKMKATWPKMKELASPELRTRMDSIEKVARAYEKIGASTSELGDKAADKAPGYVGKLFRDFRSVKPTVLKWALEHPARAEILTRDIQNASSAKEAEELVRRNIANLVRLYEMDKGKPPEKPGSGGTMDLFAKELL